MSTINHSCTHRALDRVTHTWLGKKASSIGYKLYDVVMDVLVSQNTSGAMARTACVMTRTLRKGTFKKLAICTQVGITENIAYSVGFASGLALWDCDKNQKLVWNASLAFCIIVSLGMQKLGLSNKPKERQLRHYDKDCTQLKVPNIPFHVIVGAVGYGNALFTKISELSFSALVPSFLVQIIGLAALQVVASNNVGKKALIGHEEEDLRMSIYLAYMNLETLPALCVIIEAIAHKSLAPGKESVVEEYWKETELFNEALFRARAQQGMQKLGLNADCRTIVMSYL